MRKIFFLILIFLINSAICFGCTGDLTESSIKITDDTGNEVTVPHGVERVASLAPSETEIFYGLNPEEKGIKLVARTDYCVYPEEAESVTSVGGPHTLSIEAIVAQEPELILATSITDQLVVDELMNLGYPVVIFNIESFDGVYRNIMMAGEILGLSDNAEILVNSIKNEVRAVEDESKSAPLPAVMYVVWADPLYVAGTNTLQDEFILISGGENVFEDKKGYFVASDESVVERDPDIIIVPTSEYDGYDLHKLNLLKKEAFKDLKAVKSDRIYVVDEDPVSRPGPRIIEGLKLFSQCING